MLKLLNAQPLTEYRLELQFSDGRNGTADLSELVTMKPDTVFSSLRSSDLFQQCRIKHGALTWSGELDLAPEYLYFLSFREDPTLTPLFKSWGYL